MRSLALAGCIAGAALAACAQAPEPLARAAAPIVSGQPTTGSPATVYLDLGGGSCSGTLISPHVVLTARHCTVNTSPAQVNVFFGANAGGQGTWIGVTDVENHPQGDISMVRLAQPGPTSPMPYFSGNLAQHVGESVHLVGFGVTSENGTDSGLKREGYTKLDHLDGDIMYTGYDLTGSWTCYGDSGGTIAMTIGGVEQVVAVTSFGTSVCGQPADGNTRTDTYKDWIAAYVAAVDPSPCLADGSCNTACPMWETADPDCAGCAADGTCRADCPAVDVDCCGADGACHQACAGTAADPDCGGGTPDGDGEGDGDVDGDGDGDGDGNGGGGDDQIGEPPSVIGGCSAGGRAGSTAGAFLVVAALALAARRRRRR
jgi:MYXO-CTERM domain-containing protein